MGEKGIKRRNIAVVVVDVQGDFTESGRGSLAVPGTGDDYVEDVEKGVRLLKEDGFLIFGTQDWHPADHISFAASHENRKPGDVIALNGRNQVLWPVHCVQGTDQARVLIDNSLFLTFVRKGSHPGLDSYSGFEDDGGNETELNNLLRAHGVTRIVVFGLATDYCVKYTVLDGLKRGYAVSVVETLCGGITPESAAQAMREMADRGAVILKTPDAAKSKSM